MSGTTAANLPCRHAGAAVFLLLFLSSSPLAAASAMDGAADVPGEDLDHVASEPPARELPSPAAALPARAESEESPLDRNAAGEPTADELLRLAREDAAALGPLSIGTPDSGLLLNPVPMPEGDLWHVRDPRESYGTTETIRFVETAIEAVEDRYPGSPRLVIGDISRPDGGRLNRHRSHQAGRDADLGFYYGKGENGRFQAARKDDLDLPRNWALLRALLTETDVEFIFLDRSLMRLLYAYALEQGEDREWLDEVFGRMGEDRKGIIQHVKKHKDHLHVRFFNRMAQQRGRIVYAALVETGAVPPPALRHRVRRGETIGALAIRYGVRASAIRAANGLRGNNIRAGRSYVIPVRRVPVDNGPIVFPARRLPAAAARAAQASAPEAAESNPTAAARP